MDLLWSRVPTENICDKDVQKIPNKEEVIAFILSHNLNEGINQTSRGKDLLISPESACGRRGGKGKQVIKEVVLKNGPYL